MIEKQIDYIDDPNDTYEVYLAKAKAYDFRCIFANPEVVDIAKTELKGTSIIMAGAIDFPDGTMELETKMERFQLYADLGFQEIDYVLYQQHVEEENFEEIYKEMKTIHEFCIQYGIREKVIVEMCKLKTESAKRSICEIANKVMPAYLKTSTGKSWAGAQLDDVTFMRQVLKKEIKIKAAGGIKTYAQAKAFLDAGADILGATAGIQIVEEERMEKST